MEFNYDLRVSFIDQVRNWPRVVDRFSFSRWNAVVTGVMLPGSAVLLRVCSLY